MYKVYLKVFNARRQPEVLPAYRTTTPNPQAAAAAFRALIRDDKWRGSSAHAVLSLDNRQLMYHRFDRRPGQADYVAPDAEIRLHHDQ